MRMKSVVEKLLENNATVNTTDMECKAALHYAFDRHIPFDGGYQGGDGYGGSEGGENLSTTNDSKLL